MAPQTNDKTFSLPQEFSLKNLICVPFREVFIVYTSQNLQINSLVSKYPLVVLNNFFFATESQMMLNKSISPRCFNKDFFIKLQL